MPDSFLETIILNDKTVADLLTGDPMTNAEAAYQLLHLFSRACWPPLGHLTLQCVENGLRKQYEAYLTGVDPDYLSDEDVKDRSLLGALMFLRQVGKEAEAITKAVDYTWRRLEAKRKLNSGFEITMALYKRVEEGDEFSKQLLNLLREMSTEIERANQHA